MPPMGTSPTILVFDSGLGGLTVHREVVKARPDARIVYAADDAGFPYGPRPEPELVEHVLAVMADLLAAWTPDLVVIGLQHRLDAGAAAACARAFRCRSSAPCRRSSRPAPPRKTRLVSVLGTEATVKREYTRALIRDFGQGCAVTLVGSPRLAVLAEAELNGEAGPDADIAREIAPCFVEANGGRTDIVVLACTHYPLLLDRLARLAPWPVTFIDPAPAIARRVVELLGAPGAGNRPPRPAWCSPPAGRPRRP